MGFGSIGWFMSEPGLRSSAHEPGAVEHLGLAGHTLRAYAPDVTCARVAAVHLAGTLAVHAAAPHRLTVHARGIAHHHVAVAGVAAAVFTPFAALSLAARQRIAVDMAVVGARYVAVIQIRAIDRAVVLAGGVADVERVAINRAPRSLAVHLADLGTGTSTHPLVVADRV